MIVTTAFPDLAPRPETAANAAFRRRFRAHWGRVNSVFVATTRQAETAPLPTALSLKTLLAGRATLLFDRGRRLHVEPGRWLLTDAGGEYAVSIASATPVRCLSLHFDPALAQQVALAQRLAPARALDDGATLDGAARPLLRTTLRAPDPRLLPRLARIHERALAHAPAHAGADPGAALALEEDFVELLAALLPPAAPAAAGSLRAAGRQELARRVGWAADFIETWYAEPLTLTQIAAAAHLSKFHLVRAFRAAYGCTPHQALLRRRAEAAQRLLAEPERPLADVAAASGFGSRWALQRALRRHCGAGARRLRERAA